MTPLRTTAAALACATALAASGCGSKKDEGNPIPRDVASAISEELTSVQNRLNFATENPDARGKGACNDIEGKSFPAIERDLERVPNAVGQDVRDALTQSVDRLHELTRSECDKVKGKARETDTTPTEPTPTEPLPPETQPVPTEPIPTTPTTQEPKKPTKPKKPKQPLPGPGSQPDTGGTGGAAPGNEGN